MYAVIEDGSRQYRISAGDIVRLDHREAELGTKLELDHVLMIKTDKELIVGKPRVEGAKVVVRWLAIPRSSTTSRSTAAVRTIVD